MAATLTRVFLQPIQQATLRRFLARPALALTPGAAYEGVRSVHLPFTSGNVVGKLLCGCSC